MMSSKLFLLFVSPLTLDNKIKRRIGISERSHVEQRLSFGNTFKKTYENHRKVNNNVIMVEWK